LIHIQTSSLLAKAYEKQSSAGVQAHLYVEQGELVPDALITTMVLQRIKEPDAIEKGFILEGFPRTKDQAASLLQAGLIPDHVVYIDIPDEVIKKENEPLKLDTVTNRVYNVLTDLSVQNNIIESRLVPKYTPEVLSRKLDIFRRNHRELMELFPSQNARFYLPDGITGQEHDLLEKIHRFLGTCPISASPRGFRIIVSGLPGSGKSTIADYIAEKYGAVAGIRFLTSFT
jgi:adenylate kinase